VDLDQNEMREDLKMRRKKEDVLPEIHSERYLLLKHSTLEKSIYPYALLLRILSQMADHVRKLLYRPYSEMAAN